jgi:hypothetical protein
MNVALCLTSEIIIITTRIQYYDGGWNIKHVPEDPGNDRRKQ